MSGAIMANGRSKLLLTPAHTDDFRAWNQEIQRSHNAYIRRFEGQPDFEDVDDATLAAEMPKRPAPRGLLEAFTSDLRSR